MTGATVKATDGMTTAVNAGKPTTKLSTATLMSTGAPGTMTAATGAAKAAGVISTGGDGAAAGPLAAPHR